MNILIVSDTYKPHVNGLVTAIETQLIALKKSRAHVYLLIPDFKKYKDKNILTVPGIPWPPMPEFKITSIFSLGLLRKIKKFHIDIIHSHTPFSLGIFAIVISRIFKIPIIHTYHTYFEEYTHYARLPKSIGKIIAKLFSRWYCNSMDHIITPSSFMKRTLEEYGIKKKITVLPTGYDLNIFKSRKYVNWRKKYNISSDLKVLLYVGRIAKEKNLYFLVQLFKELYTRYDNIYMVITGGGPEWQNLNKYIKKLKLSEVIKLTGVVKFDNIHNIYAMADLFVFPSLTETQGLVLLEAMLNNIPIVSFYKRGTKEVLPSRKILGISPVRTKGEFIKETKFYLKGNYNKKAMKNNLNKYIQRFNEDKIIKKLFFILKSSVIKY